MSINSIPLGYEPSALDSRTVLSQARALLELWMKIGPSRVLDGLTIGELARRVAEVEHIEARMGEIKAEISWTQISQQFAESDDAADGSSTPDS